MFEAIAIIIIGCAAGYAIVTAHQSHNHIIDALASQIAVNQNLTVGQKAINARIDLWNQVQQDTETGLVILVDRVDAIEVIRETEEGSRT